MGAEQKTHRVLRAGGLGEARMTDVRGAEPVATNLDSESPSLHVSPTASRRNSWAVTYQCCTGDTSL